MLPAARAQDDDAKRKSIMGHSDMDSLSADSLKGPDIAPLDIPSSRGIYIQTPDRKMQLRILGSVRFLAVFDNTDLADKNRFDAASLNTGSGSGILLNYYNGLDQTRLGFEVKRRTLYGDVFVRLETDFAGINGFRIRHAYGQIGNWLLGQTWSLFAQINALPASIDLGGPTGAVTDRTPQIRYSFPNQVWKKIYLSIGAEYVIPDVKDIDSLTLKSVQLFPDITCRLNRSFEWGNMQVSGILPLLTARDSSGKVRVKAGWGISASAIINSWAHGKWYLQYVMGRGITRFINNLEGQGLDLYIKPDKKVVLPFVYGLNAAYEHAWNKRFLSNGIFSLVRARNYDFNPDNILKRAGSFRVNTFYKMAEGARLGAELSFGFKRNKGLDTGTGSRLSLLAYYDF